MDIRPIEPGPPWDYEAIASDRMRTARTVLDMGTGGGEVLSRVTRGTSATIVATEEWSINAPVARARLAPLGIGVIRSRSVQLPFSDATFDLVLNRHEELDPGEIDRVLRPGGGVVTQQVGHDTWPELTAFFPRRTRFPNHFDAYRRGFEVADMAVSATRHSRRVAYRTLGDLVFMLMVSPWTIPDFDPAHDIDALLRLERECADNSGVVLTETCYLIVAQKPG